MKQEYGVCNMDQKRSYAKARLTEAMLRLLKTKKIDEISVSELCEAAGLSRISFYRNYPSLEDILKQHFETITSSFLKDTSLNFRTTPRKEFIRYLAGHMLKHKELVSLLMENGLSYLLKEAFDEAFLRSVEIYHDPYRCYAASGAYFNLISYWFRSGCRESPEELAELDISF